MREILFRGKRVDNGEWVEGGIIPLDPDSGYIFIAEPYLSASTLPVHEIVKHHMHLVAPDTVGQCTDLTANGKKIFEGDIVKFGDILGIINFGSGCYCVKTNKPDWRGRNNPAIDIVFNEYPNEIKIIGNIHDNPELLKGGTNK